MKKFQNFFIYYFIFLFAFGLGIYFYANKVWPYERIKEVLNFISGHAEEQTTIADKVINDLGLRPLRFVTKFDHSALNNNLTYEKITELNLKPHRDSPLIFLSEDAAPGYRVILGTFDFSDSLHGALLIDLNGKIQQVWKISQNKLTWKHQKDTNLFPHGFVIAPDGSIVVAFDGGNSLTKYDYCGRIIWRLKGGFHHSIEFEDNNYIWVWGQSGSDNRGNNYLSKIDYKTGETIKSFSLKQIMSANPEIDIMGIRQKDTAKGFEWADDRFHANDIDPLPERLAGHYRNFNAGDLLVSLRSLNLIFVIDPESLRVKWWRQGLARRQHDPDWNDAGTITVFNNNMHREYSNILEIDPLTFETKTLLDGKNYNFYTWMRGKHQIFNDGKLLITSSQQGRVFEVDKKGKVTFEFLNKYQDNKVLVISEAYFLPLNFFEDLPQCN